MTPDQLDLAILQYLYRSARATAPADPNRIAPELGARRSQIRIRLSRLERAGLVDARRCRLTLPGLAVAVASAAAALALAA